MSKGKKNTGTFFILQQINVRQTLQDFMYIYNFMYIYKRQNISRSIKFLLTFHGPVHCSTKRAPFARTPLREVECLSVDDADFFRQ